jgi:monoamine oxidase
VSYDVLIIGAGAAGLSAAQDLTTTGRRVLCVEARDRVGGRILTTHDAATPFAIEFGAEFVHGGPSQILDLANRAGLHIYETAGRPVSLADNGDSPLADGLDILEDVAETATEDNDETFQQFLDRSTYPDPQKQQAIAFVEGFNAARRNLIGTASLAHDQHAADEIGGDRTFRIREGYDALIAALALNIEVRLDSPVDAIQWRPGAVAVHLTTSDTLHARRVLITVPLGVLHSSAIRFDPEPAESLAAARTLCFGDAFRVTFLFDHPFWDDSPTTRDAGFLFSDEPLFPVWWTGRPLEPCVITGWSAGPKADPLLGIGADAVIESARTTLARTLRRPQLPPHGAFFHDWHADPYSRGAYSYVPAGGLPARRKLAEPVADTMYFAGEATDLLGYGGTVHGAIASGKRAAQQILASG